MLPQEYSTGPLVGHGTLGEAKGGELASRISTALAMCILPGLGHAIREKKIKVAEWSAPRGTWPPFSFGMIPKGGR